MSTQTINISLPKELLEQVDLLAKIEFASRSDYIRQALVNKLREDRARQADWDLLEALSEEIGTAVDLQRYQSDQDFVLAVKEVRASQLKKSKK